MAHMISSLFAGWLDNSNGPAILIWVPGHKGTPGNEVSDELVKAAADNPPRPISFATAKTLIRRTIIDPPLNRPRTAMVDEILPWKWDRKAISKWADVVILVRLRPGHMPALKACAQLLDPAADPTYPLCMEEPQTVKHWLQEFLNLDILRQIAFGGPSPTLKVLTTDPEKVLVPT